MAATGFTLADAVSARGVARVFIGDPFTPGGMVCLPTEGAISEVVPQAMNDLALGELTGETPLSGVVVNGKAIVTVPVIYTGAATMALLSAHGSASEGYNSPQEPTYTSLMIVPLSELDTTADPPTISYDGAAWAPAAPSNARFYWRVVPVRPDFSTAFENNGKVILSVTFNVYIDTDRPSGHMIRTWGNPVAAGITTVRI